MVEGQGFSFDVDALYAYAGTAAGLASEVAGVRAGLDAAGPLPAGVFGEVGEASGFVAAFAERTGALGTSLEGIRGGVDGIGTAVRGYVEAKLALDDDTVAELRRTEEAV